MKKLLPVFVTLWIMALSVSAQEEETYTVVKDSSSINVDFDEYPQFPGGADACLRWLNEHVRYPIICLEQGIEGRVVVTFVIRRDGSIVVVVILSKVFLRKCQMLGWSAIVVLRDNLC